MKYKSQVDYNEELIEQNGGFEALVDRLKKGLSDKITEGLEIAEIKSQTTGNKMLQMEVYAFDNDEINFMLSSIQSVSNLISNNDARLILDKIHKTLSK